MSEPTPTSAGALAALIVDALMDAGLVRRDDFEAAVSVATEEIVVRRALGSSFPPRG